jgi:hypothetical protein
VSDQLRCGICGQSPEQCTCIDENPSRLSWYGLLIRARCLRARAEAAESRAERMRSALTDVRDALSDAEWSIKNNPMGSGKSLALERIAEGLRDADAVLAAKEEKR